MAIKIQCALINEPPYGTNIQAYKNAEDHPTDGYLCQSHVPCLAGPSSK